MKKLLQNNWQLALIFVLGIFVSLPLFRSGYFSHQDDLHVIRIVEIRKCFTDFQIPCRWVPDMGWGNGMPVFNFYGVSVYYIGAILSYFVGFLGASKLLFFASLIFGSFGLYLLVRDLWGKYAGLTSAVLYMFAPYKALDVYVRGALSESMALAIIPFVFYFFYKKSFGWATFFLALFLITHNIMTVVFLPVIIVWILYLLWSENREHYKLFLLSLLLAFGLSAFFTLPAFLEKNLVQTESLTRFELDYRANFISIRQLFFDRVWGYGTSIPGPTGAMNFQIGWPHWILAVFTPIFLFFRKTKKHLLLTTFYFLLFVISIYMTHNKSTIFWENISILQFFQFPRRFLSLSIFTSSLLGGVIVFMTKEKWQKILAIIIISLTVLLNWGYFRPREYYDINDSQKLTGNLWEEQRRGALLDYLPKTALEPREGAPENPLIISGEAKLINFVNQSNRFSFNADVMTVSQIDIPVFYFPNWEVKVDGNKHLVTHDNILGRISILLTPGQHEVIGNFKNTPLRTFANMISIISLFALLGFIKCKK